MRWIKHLTTAHADEAIDQILSEFGPEGYGVYWLMCEEIASMMEKDSTRTSITHSDTQWAAICHCSVRKWRRICARMSDLRLICAGSALDLREFCAHRSANRTEIDIPNLLKYRDEYSKKSGHKSGQSPENVLSRVDTDTEQIQKTEKNADLQKLPVVVASEWPKSAAVVRRRFQSTDEPMVLRIVQGGLQAWLSVDQPKIREPDDGLIAEALEVCWQESRGKQTSAALWLQTLPRLMTNWAQHGRPAAPEPIAVDPKMRAIQEARRKYGSSRINA